VCAYKFNHKLSVLNSTLLTLSNKLNKNSKNKSKSQKKRRKISNFEHNRHHNNFNNNNSILHCLYANSGKILHYYYFYSLLGVLYWVLVFVQQKCPTISIKTKERVAKQNTHCECVTYSANERSPSKFYHCTRSNCATITNNIWFHSNAHTLDAVLGGNHGLIFAANINYCVDYWAASFFAAILSTWACLKFLIAICFSMLLTLTRNGFSPALSEA